MIWITDTRDMVLLVRKGRSKRYALTCIGPKRHYRKDGSCTHIDDIWACIRPEARPRVKIDPWGGRRGPHG